MLHYDHRLHQCGAPLSCYRIFVRCRRTESNWPGILGWTILPSSRTLQAECGVLHRLFVYRKADLKKGVRGKGRSGCGGRADKMRSLRLCVCLQQGPGARLGLEGYVYQSKEHSSKALHQPSWQEGRRRCITSPWVIWGPGVVTEALHRAPPVCWVWASECGVRTQCNLYIHAPQSTSDVCRGRGKEMEEVVLIQGYATQLHSKGMKWEQEKLISGELPLFFGTAFSGRIV